MSAERPGRSPWATLGLLLLLPALALGGTARAATLMVDASEYPWSAIGRINTGGRGFCTGFLVGERTVLTAAHCLYDFREGRWWHERDVHFVAGYQRDRWLMHARAQSYRVASQSTPTREPEIEAVVDDWAVIALDAPIGRQVGWLGLRRLDGTLLGKLRDGSVAALQAGYRRDRGHVITLGTDCQRPRFFGRGRGILHRCDVVEGGSGSPLLIFADGELQAIGIHAIRIETDRGDNWAGVVNTAIVQPGGGLPEAIRVANRTQATWGLGRTPSAEGPGSPVPTRTIGTLLAQLGYLPATRKGVDDQIAHRKAIRAFERRSGLPETGLDSVALLGRLIDALP